MRRWEGETGSGKVKLKWEGGMRKVEKTEGERMRRWEVGKLRS
jgi:hypothetical protein